jgi:hypothetical protein
MPGRHWRLLLACFLLPLVGCTRSRGPSEHPATSISENPEADSTDTSEPARAVTVFFDALLRGDDEGVLQMYTARAREQIAQVDSFGPKASDTAEFEASEVEYLAEDGARVACRLTDLDQDGKRHTFELVCAVRRESKGWRVAGIAVYPGPGEKPVIFDFENLKQAMRNRERLEEDILRGKDEDLEAGGPNGSPDSVRR